MKVLVSVIMKYSCQHCNRYFDKGNLKKHEKSCYLNPVNLRLCFFCDKPIRNYKSSKGTCSKSCSNSYFRRGPNNGSFKGSYQSVCFFYHEKKCVVCGEDKIVAVHHYDENRKNNTPENLIPMCPTHHQYMHSRFKSLIDDIVKSYIKNKHLTIHLPKCINTRL